MSQWCMSVVDALRKPEWIAALALLIQAVILFLQWKILGRHATTMEKHAEIAGTQATTAELIGKTLEEQGKIHGAQTKIMEEQFKFIRTVEIKAERVQVFSDLLELDISFGLLLTTHLQIPMQNYTADLQQSQVRPAWKRMYEDLLRCSRTVHTSAFLEPDERQYFLNYVTELRALKESSDIRKDLEVLKAFNEKYKNCRSKMLLAGRTAAS